MFNSQKLIQQWKYSIYRNLLPDDAYIRETESNIYKQVDYVQVKFFTEENDLKLTQQFP